jgi:hypothetical protein
MQANATKAGIAAMLVAWSCSAAALPPPQAQAGSSDPQVSSLDMAANMPCPPGLERFVPGVYYYCVGARDLARHQDDRGREMLELAAAWGSKPAQLTLGVGYFKGDAMPLNRPLGLAWLGLAAERRDPAYVAIFKSAWDKASPDEQARAQSLWQDMRPKYGDDHAAHRAERRYRRERWELVRNEIYDVHTCIAGLTVTQVVPSEGVGGPDCVGSMSLNLVAKKIDVYADSLFEGWSGHVSVGQLQQVAPGK